jgi:hypothetical protein
MLMALVNRANDPSPKPMVILVHGLTGCEDSHHLLVSSSVFLARGYSVLRLNLRGAGPSRVTCRKHYHSGLSADLSAVIESVQVMSLVVV